MDTDLILLLITWYDWMIDFFDRFAQLIELVFVYSIDWLIDKWNSLFLIVPNVSFV